MELSEIRFDGVTPIDSYGPGFFRLGGAVVEGPVAVFATYRLAWAGFDDTEALVARADEIDVLLVGTGSELLPLPPGFERALTVAGVGLEPMATPAACRTYNVLLAEGRRVAAALIPI